MRAKADYQSQVYYAIDIEAWIPENHPLRSIKARADRILSLMRRAFDRTYSRTGRKSIPPEMLLKTLLLPALYSVSSERQLVEQIQVNLLYRWFINLSLDGPVWDATTFTKNRKRFEHHGPLRKFFDRVVERAYLEQWASEEDFMVDGTPIESYASLKSLLPLDSADERASDGSDDKDPGNPTVGFHGQRRTNPTDRTLTDQEARRRAKRRQRTTRYVSAQRIRKRVEEIIGWGKTIGGLRRSRHVGRWTILRQAPVVGVTYNLPRLTRLEAFAGVGP